MKSSAPLSILLFLASTQALPQRSTHDTLLQRNFKNVLPNPEKAALANRSPQGPTSNPGEFTNVGLSNVNPANYIPQMGGNGISQSDSSTITSSASLASETPDLSSSIDYASSIYNDSGPAFESAYPPSLPADQSALSTLFDSFYQPTSTPDATATSTRRRHHHHTDVDNAPPRSTGAHHHRPCKASVSGGSCPPEPTGHHRHRPCKASVTGGSCRPEPTGGHHRHRNSTGGAEYSPPVGTEYVQTEVDMGPGNVMTVHETLWEYNGTGWNHTEIPLPSGTVTLPPSTASGDAGGGTETGMPGMGMGMGMNDGEVPIDNGFSGPSFMYNGPRPGFVGPKEGGVVGKEKRRWLSGIF